MTLLRTVLLALALVMFAAVGWRLTGPQGSGAARRTVVATAPDAPGSDRPASQTPATASLPTPARPDTSGATQAGTAGSGQRPAAAAAPAAAPPLAATEPARPATPTESASAAPTAAADAMTSRLAATPDLARVFDQLKATFPAVADRSLSTAADTLRKKGEWPTPDDFVAGAMRDARLSAGVLAARAGPEALAAIFEAKAATLAELEAADPRICADYVYGGTSPEFNDFAVTHRALVARADLATLAAMADGRTRQNTWDAPSAEDYAAIETALKQKGLSADEIAAVLDGKSLDPPPSDTRLCDNARAYLDAMRTMPDAARNRVYALAAELLARS